MNGDWFWLSVAWITSVSARIRWFRLLHEQETPGDVSFLRDHGYTASGRVVGDYLRQRSEKEALSQRDQHGIGWIVFWKTKGEKEKGRETYVATSSLLFDAWKLELLVEERGR